MTKEDLIKAHATTGVGGIGMQHVNSAKISIEYAISVLEEVRQDLINQFMTKSAKTIGFKIDQLQRILHET